MIDTWTADRLEWLRKRVRDAEFCHIGKWGDPEWDRDIQGDIQDILAERDALVRYVKSHGGNMREAYDALPEYLRKEIEG